ncbi:MAG: glucose 1-dehydrogenase [Proteobacteria bacterium]|nr:glucose 1-dehydrogenase [Pseudomonadota bacterium]
MAKPNRRVALFDLEGKVAVVTGASRGIGRAIARGFAAAGARVVLTSRSIEAARNAADAILEEGGTALACAMEAGVADDLAGLVDATLERFGALDVLVNNAAVLRPHRIDRVGEEELDELYRVNVKSPVMLAKLALPHLEGGGVVINLTALAGHAPMEGLGAYAASKAALLNWTRTMAREWGARGVRVNALTPGPVATDMILPADPARREAFLAEMGARTLLGRIARPEEMVGPALFLASDASSFMTGQTLVVDGGMLA